MCIWRQRPEWHSHKPRNGWSHQTPWCWVSGLQNTINFLLFCTKFAVSCYSSHRNLIHHPSLLIQNICSPESMFFLLRIPCITFLAILVFLSFQLYAVSFYFFNHSSYEKASFHIPKEVLVLFGTVSLTVGLPQDIYTSGTGFAVRQIQVPVPPVLPTSWGTFGKSLSLSPFTWTTG